MNRRNFVQNMTAGGLLLASSRARGWAQSADAHIEVLAQEPIATIAPEIYGHFIEHLGGVIYDGVWVGPNSKVANEGGIRKSLVDALKKIKAPVIRWPGGCFADSYDWRDGIGKADDRPPRSNFWGGTDPNTFGTHEFMHLSKLTGAKPYLAADLRSLPAKDFWEWVEYCNSPSETAGARRRAALGDKEPFDVHYWGVGNESWGCGGNFEAEDYASEFRRFTAWVPDYNGKRLAFIASGPPDRDVDWTRRVLHSMANKKAIRSITGLSAHYYTSNLSGGTNSNWDTNKGDALNFDEFGWYELLFQGNFMERVVRDHWTVMEESDPDHHIKLVVDEWGAWYKRTTEIGPKYAYSQQSTLRDALLSGLTLNIFNNHAEKVMMANAAQLVNCLHSLFLASEDKFVLTPTYHVFDMYASHMGAQALRTEVAASSISYPRPVGKGTLFGLNASASLQGKRVTLTVVNPHLDKPVDTQIIVRGANVTAVRGSDLKSNDMHAHNDFSQPHQLEPGTIDVKVNGGVVQYAFAPKSVTTLHLDLS